ncbi:hypothetical protein BD779DRAFT_1214954 [Infundibulicybe gibba]|nr:hypothetical protein BD779DRAFT_1214954 [Infundibulicybe gibba]
MLAANFSEVMVRSYSSLAALIFLAWDLVMSFGDEYEYMWKRNWTPVKCIYLFCRYFSLVVQIVNHVVTQGPMSKVPVARTFCRTWFAFQGACTISLVFSINALLMLRVYALYDRSRRVATFLVIIFFADVISVSIQSYLCVKASVFDQACLMTDTPPTVVSCCIEMLVMQGTLWGMTWWKRNRNESWTRTPLVSLVVRDGAFIFVGTFAIMASALPYAMFVKSLEHVAFSWFIAFLAFSACRLTINLLRLDIPGAHTQDDLELTTFIEGTLNDQFTTVGTAIETQS